MTKPPQKTPPLSSPAAEPARPEAVRITAAKCARCGQPMQPRYRPFCSQRCAEIDLGQWASGRYRVPTTEAPAGPDEDET